MASKPPRPCRHPGCSELTRDGWCVAHKPAKAVKAGRRESAEWHRWYSRQIWTQRLRPAQLLREPFCRDCAKRGLRELATRVDHVVPHRGSWALFIDPTNHQSLCERCHNRKTALEMAERRKKTSGF